MEQRQAARAFVKRWQAAEGNEQREANKFWVELFHEVLGVANPIHLLDFERKAKGRRIANEELKGQERAERSSTLRWARLRTRMWARWACTTC